MCLSDATMWGLMTRTDRRIGRALALLAFLALAALGHHTWGTVDAIQRLAVTNAVLTRGSVVTPEYGPVKYGPLQPFLMLPTYALGYGIGELARAPEPGRVGYRVTAFLFTPVLVSLLVYLWYGFARRWGQDRASAAVGAWTLLWCTLVLPYSRLLFSELLSATMLLAGVAYLCVPRDEDRRPVGFFFLALASLNYVVFVPVLLVACAALPLYELGRARPGEARRAIISGAAAILFALVGWGAYNVARYGTPLRFGYAGESFSTPLLEGLYGLLASPGRGLLYYSLPTAAAVVLAVRGVATCRDPAGVRDASALLLFGSYLLLYARWGSFEGGWCWGPRFLIPFIPLVHVALLALLPRLRVAFYSVCAAGLLANAWEYSIEWGPYEKAMFGSGVIDYRRSVFELEYVSALHGFAGSTSIERLLQFAGIAFLSSFLVARVVRRHIAAGESGEATG